MTNNDLYQLEDVRGVQELSRDSLMLTNRRTTLDDTSFSRDGAERFLKKWLYLQNSNEPISVYINSGGGEVNSGLLIYDLIQSSKAPVDIFCAGIACSMAAVILASG